MLTQFAAPEKLLDMELPMPPSSNHYWKHGKKRGTDPKTGLETVELVVYKSAEAVAFEERCTWMLKQYSDVAKHLPQRAVLRESFQLYFLPGRINTLDWTNHVKLLEDVVMGALGLNDAWVRRVSATKFDLEGEEGQGREFNQQDEYCLYKLGWTGQVDKPKSRASTKKKKQDQMETVSAA